MDAKNLVQQLGSWSDSPGPLHARLSSALENAIQQGVLLPGTRLPAERHLAEVLALSRTTVLTAYSTLKSQGWVESRTGSGTWVNTRRAISARQRTQTTVLSRSPLLNLLSLKSSETIDFAVGTTVPLSELPDHLLHTDEETHRALLCERNYMPLGLPQLREAVAQMYARAGLSTTSDQILITNGAQQAITLAVSLYVQRGDSVLIENPTYFGALDAFRLAAARLVPLSVDADHISPTRLRDLLLATGARMLYCTPTYQNPTGSLMPAAVRQRVAQIADEFGLPILEDCALADLSMEGRPPGPIAMHAKHGTVLTVSSLSKLFWAGLRVGWIRGPIAAVAQLARVKSAMDLGSPLLTQVIGAQLLTAMTEGKALRREQLSTRRDLLITLLREHLPEWTFSVPAGGLYLWVRLRDADGAHFAQFAARYGVAVTPGSLFTADESPSEFLRIPFVLDEDSIRAGVERLASAWKDFEGLAHRRPARSLAIV